MMGSARPRPKRLAEKLLMIRQRLNVSQDGMIARLGLEDEFERERISKFERDIIEPPLHVLVAYAKVANVYLEVLVEDELDLPESLTSRKEVKASNDKNKVGKSFFDFLALNETTYIVKTYKKHLFGFS